LTPKTITLNIAEGAFDILGINNHIFDGESKNMIYTAVCGSGYLSVLKYFIQMGVFGNIDINIFSDSDRPPKFYRDIHIQEDIKDWVNNITLYYNEKGKDYGVRKDQIKIIRKRL
jgi:hypothetical protein